MEPREKEKEVTLANRTWDFIMGPTPVAPEEKMREIEERMERRKSKLETDCDIKADDLKRLQRDLKKAAEKNDELCVRQLAKNFVSLQKQYKSAQLRLDKVTTQTSFMNDLRVSASVNKDMLEFIQSHNRLIAPVANPQAVQATMGRFTMQQDSMKLSEEMMSEAMTADSENEEEEEENKEVEELVSQMMNLSNLNVLSQLPSITNVKENGKQANLSNPTVTANKIQQFLDRK